MKKNLLAWITKDESESSFELDLAPMLALMVTLIPIMLLSTVFVEVNVIETPLPQVVQKALDQDRKNKDREVHIQVDMRSDHSFSLMVLQNGQRVLRQGIRGQEQDWDWNGLHSQIVEIKQKYPKTFRLHLNPDESVKYDMVVRTIDKVRRSGVNDPKIYIFDEESGEKVATDLLFPDVVFSNILEG